MPNLREILSFGRSHRYKLIIFILFLILVNYASFVDLLWIWLNPSVFQIYDPKFEKEIIYTETSSNCHLKLCNFPPSLLL